MKPMLLTSVMLALFAVFACNKSEPRAEQMKPAARVFFVAPADGAVVTSPVKVKMGVEGMMIQPAGEVREGTGHHHIIINGDYEPAGAVIPADATHLHFGKGQTEAELKLKPGKYTLTLQFADGKHASYGRDLSSTIHLTVK